MNIDITDEEYGTLLELLFMAERVLTSHKEGDARLHRYISVIQKLYSSARDTSHAEKIVYDDDLEKHRPARVLESGESRRLLDEFVDETFWHELVYRLTERDVERAAGGYEQLLNLGEDQRFDLEVPIEEKYLEEFERHGIERLEVVERFESQGTMPKTSD